MWSSIPTPYHVVANPNLYDHTVHGFAVAVPCQMVPCYPCVLVDSLAMPCSLDQREVECLPNTVRESLDLLDHKDVWAMQQVPWNSKAQGWQEGSGNAALYEDSSTQASSSLNAGLEQHCYWGAPWQAPQSPPSQAQRWGPSACTEAGRSYDSPYSPDGNQPSTSQLNHSATTYAMVPEQDSPALATATETARCERSSPLYSRQAGRRADPIHGSVATCKAGVPEMDREESSDFLEEDKNIVVGESSSRPEAGGDRSAGAGTGGEAPHTVERGTSPSPRVVTSDVSVGTETRCVSVEAQTKLPATADKNPLTTLQMADLGYLAEEFVKLKSAKKELHELRQKLKRYSVHWHAPSSSIGVALEDVTTSSLPLDGWNMEMRGGKECPLFPKSEDPKEAKRQNAPAAHSKVKLRRAVSQMPKHSGTDNKQTVDPVTEVVAVESQMEGDSTELITGEEWYDAKEDLEPSVVMVPTGLGDTHSKSDEEIKEGLPKKVEEQESSFVCVSGLPKDVTEDDVMQWFEKDHVSGVRFCPFGNHLTVAMVTVKGPLAAELAVGKMNGVCVQGSTLHVQHIRPVTKSSSPALQTPIASSKVPEEETGGATKPCANKTRSSLTVGKVPGPDKHKVLSHSPTAEGTYVPEHYGTMGGFDKMMDALKERHPEAGRLAIVGALQEVKTRHRGMLSGLPLSSIVEMVSKQLAASSSSGATAVSGGSGRGDTVL